jgi:hypothetical protein
LRSQDYFLFAFGLGKIHFRSNFRRVPLLYRHSPPARILLSSLPYLVRIRAAQILDAGLNATQVRAVTHEMAADHIYLIHGPPGTGKVRRVDGRINHSSADNMAITAIIIYVLRMDAQVNHHTWKYGKLLKSPFIFLGWTDKSVIALSKIRHSQQSSFTFFNQ